MSCVMEIFFCFNYYFIVKVGVSIKKNPRFYKRPGLKSFVLCYWLIWASIDPSILKGKKVLVKLLLPQNGPEKNFQISAPPGPGKMSTFFPFKIERQIEAHSNQEHEAKILSLSLFIKRGNRFFCHRYLKRFKKFWTIK